ncbi:MAG: TrkA family potassium uptake protein [Actinobacteria bacterium]|nr:TrkA family potassium uptake protein [Actinomycetota bacterium]MBW3643251.1 TrkA family potassium uptake protein [Actinomycetota bacterium]
MHVVVVGCGRVGSQLAALASAEGHSVGIIDKREAAFVRLPSDFAGRSVTGFGFDRDRLVEAGIEEADALAAVTSGDNSNIVVARIARETFGIERVVARIYDPGRAAIYARLGIPTVATVAWTTDQALRKLLPAEARTEWTDPSGRVCMVEHDLPLAWAGRPLRDLDEAGRWRLAAVTRAGQALVPGPDLVGQEGDVLLFSAAVGQISALEKRLAGGTGSTDAATETKRRRS